MIKKTFETNSQSEYLRHVKRNPYLYLAPKLVYAKGVNKRQTDIQTDQIIWILLKISTFVCGHGENNQGVTQRYTYTVNIYRYCIGII